MTFTSMYAITTISTLLLMLSTASFTAMAVEKSEYKILDSEESFEIREYPPQIVAEALVEGDFDGAGNQGFRRLFNYISGNNRSGPQIEMTAPVTQMASPEKIAMTAPVGQVKSGDSWRIIFIMPAKYDLPDLPEPVDKRVNLTREPKKTMAAIRYSGTWSTDRYLEKKALLEKFVEERGLEPVGEPVWARYDPPFMPWFLRRNEILIPIAY